MSCSSYIKIWGDMFTVTKVNDGEEEQDSDPG